MQGFGAKEPDKESVEWETQSGVLFTRAQSIPERRKLQAEALEKAFQTGYNTQRAYRDLGGGI